MPINLAVAKLSSIGTQLVQDKAGVRYWAASPESGAEGVGFKLGLVLLFPIAREAGGESGSDRFAT